jgi:hypothetical protein
VKPPPLLAAALALPTEERAEIAARLLESLEDGEADPGAEEASDALIDERIAAFDRGEAQLVSGDEALAGIRAGIGSKR